MSRNIRRLGAFFALAFVSLLVLAPLAIAQDPNAPDPDSASALVDGLRKIVHDWGELGAIGGLIALVGLLTQVTKVPTFAAFIPVTVRPWIAAGLGVVGGLLGGVASGNWLQGIISGILAGAAAIGLNQMWASSTPGGRAKKEAAAAVASALEGPMAEAKANATALKGRLDAIAAQPDTTARLKALAAAANAATSGVR